MNTAHQMCLYSRYMNLRLRMSSIESMKHNPNKVGTHFFQGRGASEKPAPSGSTL